MFFGACMDPAALGDEVDTAPETFFGVAIDPDALGDELETAPLMLQTT